MSTTPCENPTCRADSSPYGTYRWGGYVPADQRVQVEQRPTGRPRRYCSDACRQDAYRTRRQPTDSDRQRREREALHEQRLRDVESVVQHVLADLIPTNSRVSTTMRRAIGSRITRQLALAALIDLP